MRYSKAEIKKGERVEAEHKAVVKSAKKRLTMVKEHLKERPDYYSMLERAERTKPKKKKSKLR